MNIIHITPYFYPAWSYGGIPRLSFYMALYQANMGHRVRVVTTDALDETSRQPQESFIIEGIRVRVYRNMSNKAAYHSQLFLPRGIWREWTVPGEFDIMHIHGHRNLFNAAMAFFGRRAGIPIILEPNGTLVNIERRIFLKQVYDFILGERQVRNTTAFIAVSQVEKDQFIEMGIPEHKIRIIPNGVYMEQSQTQLDFKRHYGMDCPYILYMGKITPRKGIEHIVQAMPYLHDKSIKLVIAGNDMGHLEAVRQEAAGLGLGDRVIFTGLLTGEMKAAAYQGALYTVYASRDEIFGLVPFECIICGTPVIVASDSGCAEWISRARAGHVIPYADPRAIAEVVNNYDEDQEAQNMEHGRRFIAENLTWDNVAAQVVQFYKEVIAGSQE
jgi:glycosyltransferase involved in cell wall biosynthesis